MAIYHMDIEQRTEQWELLRLGIPTASRFGEIVTPKKCELSKQAEDYMDELLAEWINGAALDEGYSNQWMDRGEALEANARGAYQFVKECEVKLCGFVTRDDGMVGASPDGLLDDDGILELKCPKPINHAHYMRTEKLEDKYHPQIQGLLYVCERDYVDIESYCPPMPPVIVRVGRDEKYIDALAKALDSFVEVLLKAREAMESKYGPVIQRIRQVRAVTVPPARDFDAFCRPVV